AYNNTKGFYTSWDTAGCKAMAHWPHDAKGNEIEPPGHCMLFQNNIVEFNYCVGLWLDGSVVKTNVVRNIFRNNRGAGCMVEISDNNVVAYNQFYDNSLGLFIHNTSRTRIYNNSFAGNNRHILVDDNDRNNTDAAQVKAGATWIARGNVIKNN